MKKVIITLLLVMSVTSLIFASGMFDITATAGMDARFIIEKSYSIGDGKPHIFGLSGDARYHTLALQPIFAFDFDEKEIDTKLFLNSSIPMHEARFNLGLGYDFENQKFYEKLDLNYDINSVVFGFYGMWPTEFKFSEKNWTELMNFSEINKATFGFYAGYRFYDSYSKAHKADTRASRYPMNLTIGTSYMYSHLGVSFDKGSWEFGSKLFTSMPNLYIYRKNKLKGKGYETGDTSPDRLYGGLASFGVDFFGLYSVTDKEHFELELGPALLVSQFHGDYLDLDLRYMNVSLNLDAKATWWIAGHSGLYIETSLPVLKTIWTDHNNPKLTNISQLIEYEKLTFKYMTRIGYVFKIN